jgi:hypothetical protein
MNYNIQELIYRNSLIGVNTSFYGVLLYIVIQMIKLPIPTGGSSLATISLTPPTIERWIKHFFAKRYSFPQASQMVTHHHWIHGSIWPALCS